MLSPDATLRLAWTILLNFHCVKATTVSLAGQGILPETDQISPIALVKGYMEA